MSEPTTDPLAPLLRQRRFLMAMNLVLLAVCWLGVTPGSQVTIIGITLNLTHPEHLTSALWIAWFWSLLRYWQRLYERFQMIRNKLSDEVNAEDQRIASAYARGIVNRRAANGEIAELPTSARVEGRIIFEQLPPNDAEIAIFGGDPSARLRGFRPNSKGGRLYPSATVTLSWQEGSQWGIQEFPVNDITLSPWQTRRLRARAWLRALWNLPTFSEHIAPTILALVVSLFGIYRLITYQLNLH